MKGAAMSVPVGMRGESKLEVQVKCEELVSHTVHTTTNANVFDPKYQAFINRVVDCAVAIGQDVWEANGIKVSAPADYELRHRLQERAIRNINVLLYLMTIARKLFHLRGSKYRAWVEKARAAKALARKWRDSDARRYGRLIQDAGCGRAPVGCARRTAAPAATSPSWARRAPAAATTPSTAFARPRIVRKTG